MWRSNKYAGKLTGGAAAWLIESNGPVLLIPAPGAKTSGVKAKE
jgi:hypothetical protein